MSLLPPQRPERGALLCIAGITGPFAWLRCRGQPPKPARGAKRGVDGGSASRAKMAMPGMRPAGTRQTASIGIKLDRLWSGRP
jgi:hypothetical protein